MTGDTEHTVIVPLHAQGYLNAAARIRSTTPDSLVQKIVDLVLRDQMILAVLDDDDSQPGKHFQRLPVHSSLRVKSPTLAAGCNGVHVGYNRSPGVSTVECKRLILEKALAIGKLCASNMRKPNEKADKITLWYPAFKLLVLEGKLRELPFVRRSDGIYYVLGEGMREKLMTQRQQSSSSDGQVA